MSEFLRLVARAFVKNEGSACIKGEAFGGTTFVFPNRRSMKFFQKYLGEEYGKVYNKPLFSPQMLTISELFSELSGLQSVDSIEAQYILYRNYIALKYCSQPVGNIIDSAILEQAMEKESFDEFIHWGNAIIADFNDIDKYLIDAKQLFTNIKDLKQLDSDYSFLSENQRKAVEQFWRNFLSGGENFKKENFSALWSIMYDLYLNFREALRERDLGYEGMIYREVAENSLFASNRYNKLVFVGFNAPNKCEKALMRWLKESGSGDFYWDFYGYMVTDPQNKASMFISDAVEEFPSRYDIYSYSHQEEQLKKYTPQFNVIGVPSGVGQAFVVADILKGIDGGDAFKTSVVLPDETLLMPVLNSMPQQFETVNVTMGFPISATPLVGFVNSIAQMQKDIKERGGKRCFYHAYITELLNHEYIKTVAADESRNLISDIIKQNYVFLDAENPLLANLQHPLLKLLFKIPGNSSELLDYLIDVLRNLDSYSEILNKDFIYRYYLCLDRLKRLNIPMRKETCMRLLSQITSSITIPFKGEPLAGLQVIGSLETRALDFENVIILSVNEGRFPASSQQNSLIPYNLRVGFGLPTYEVMDAIAAYHFYRSICRAKNVWLLYDTRSEGIQSGEVSRYVKQLKYHYNIDVNEKVVGMGAVDVKSNKVSAIAKTDKIMQKIFDRFAGKDGKPLSASSLSTYINCPLQFYLKNIEGIREENTLNEEIESNTFGTLYHYVMEQIYSAYLGEVVTNSIIEREIKSEKKIYTLIDEGFRELGIKEVVGQNIIVREVIKRYVVYTLTNDKNYTPFIYIASEDSYYCNMQISSDLSVKLQAKIDRIDKTEKGLRVIDYKTTTKDLPAEKKDKKTAEESAQKEISNLFDKQYKNRSKNWINEIFQLYLYAYVIANNGDKLVLKNGSPINFVISDTDDTINTVIYPVAKSKNGTIMSKLVYEHKLKEFEAALKECIGEIFNKDIPFTAAANDKSCEYCIFKNICGR